ncbi:hypothetical protein C6P44_005284 [Monosporozyma unispora]|nr:hypothetical protein C6P44_005284 [Kazachstania unispora]
MFWSSIFGCVIFINHVFGHSDGVDGHSTKLLDQYSLPDILSLDSIPTKNWEVGGFTKLEEGRIILTPNEQSGGSLWLKELPIKSITKGSDDLAFTLQWTFRSLNYIGPTSGGISFWVLKKDDSVSVDDVSRLDIWPKKYNGLQILIDNTGKYGESIRVILNDNSQDIDILNIDQHTLGQCLMEYQDSSVPSTLRLSYSNDHILKLQVDNKICFQTQKVKLWDHQSLNHDSVKIGVTANNIDNALPNKESFEILQMKLYNDLTTETFIPNVKQMRQPVILQKNVKTDELTVKDPMKKSYDKVNNYQLYKKLDHIEGKVIANDIADLNEKLDDIIKVQNSLIEYLLFLMKSHNGGTIEGSNNDDSQFKDFISMDNKLQQLLDEQEKIREMTTKHNSLMVSDMNSTDAVVKRVIQMWVIPLVVIVLIMGYYTFKINQDVSKTKLL